MPQHPPRPTRSIEQVVEEVGLYPIEAYEFLQNGLQFAVDRIHGEAKPKQDTGVNRHVSGRQLCEGLREFALLRWGLLARTVLSRWNITSTDDFGRMVYALIDSGWLRKSDADSIEDFHNVFTFRSAFDRSYQIDCRPSECSV